VRNEEVHRVVFLGAFPKLLLCVVLDKLNGYEGASRARRDRGIHEKLPSRLWYLWLVGLLFLRFVLVGGLNLHQLIQRQRPKTKMQVSMHSALAVL